MFTTSGPSSLGRPFVENFEQLGAGHDAEVSIRMRARSPGLAPDRAPDAAQRA